MSEYRAGFVAIVGEPNAGKSTLLNLLIGEKVSIVTPKPQTTRQRITGITTTDNYQVVFVDSPGLIQSTSGLNPFLKEEAAQVIRDADVVLVVLPADATEAAAKNLLGSLQRLQKTTLVVISKSDLLKGTATPRFFKYLIENKISFFSISALKSPEEAKSEIYRVIPPLLPVSQAPLFDAELFTTHSLRDLASEAIREACFLNLKQEIPYGLAVRIREFDERDPKLAKIRAEILVDRENHKAIVIGAKGIMLKKIGSEARAEIERLLGEKVFLGLEVIAKPGWFSNKKMLEELGYVVRE